MVGCMIYDEFKRHLGDAGISISEFAALMGMPHRQAITNYSKFGAVPDHLAVIVVLLSALAYLGVDARTALDGVDMKRKKGRGAGFDK